MRWDGHVVLILRVRDTDFFVVVIAVDLVVAVVVVAAGAAFKQNP
jgi:nitrogen fixation protein FixH